jgi:hypothetical protein
MESGTSDAASLRPATYSNWLVAIESEDFFMGMLDDIMKALDRWDVWKRVQETPDRVDELTRRIAALEEKYGGKRPGDACPFCGERAFRLQTVDMNGLREVWGCGDCKKTREIRHDLMGTAGRKMMR